MNKYGTPAGIIFSDNLTGKRSIDNKQLLFLPFWLGMPDFKKLKV
jgi:hypothetical protein